MRYVTFFTFIVVLLTFHFLLAQAPDTLWTRTYGGSVRDEGSFAHQTLDGGYIITGMTMSYGAGGGDVYLIKTNAFGDTLWTKTFGGSHTDHGKAVQQTSDNGYIIIGNTPFSVTPGVWQDGIWLIKTDAAGDTLWAKLYGDEYGAECGGTNILQTFDGGYVLSGFCGTLGFAKILLMKTDASGDSIWMQTYGKGNFSAGGSFEQTTDGGFIITGMTDTYNTGSSDVYLVKTNSLGDTLWTRIYGGVEQDGGSCVQQTTDDGFIIIGSTYSYGKGYSDVYLIKTNQLGDTIWTKTYGDSGFDGGNSVIQTSDDGYIILANTSSFGVAETSIWIIRTDSIGDIIWTKLIDWDNSEDVGYSIQPTIDGGSIICGYKYSASIGYYNALLIKLSSEVGTFNKSNYPGLPVNFTLSQNYPNPFNPTTTIEFDLPKGSEVSLKVFNILGEELATLVSDRLSAGSYSYNWDASRLASGVYLYRLKAERFVETMKMNELD